MTDRYRASPLVKVCYYVFVFAAVAISIELLRRNLPAYLPRDWPNAHEGDVLVDWKAARLVRLGISPYSRLGLALNDMPLMGHPPTTAFWYLLMADLPKGLVAELTSLAAWFLLIPHIYICAKELDWPAPMAVTGLVTSLVISSAWLLYHFDVVQCSEQIAFLYVLAWLFLRRGHDAKAGLCIGLVMTIKLFPGLLMVMLVLSRRWRAVIVATVSYGAIAGLMTWIYGLESWPMFFAQQKPVSDIYLGILQNSSLTGMVAQSLYPICIGEAHPSTAVSVISGCSALAIMAIAVWLTRSHLRRAVDTDARAIDLPFALFALLSVFLNPWAWEHYYVLVIQPLFVLTTAFWRIYRVTLRRWGDGVCSTRCLVGIGCVTVGFVCALSFVIYALTLEIWDKYWYRDLYRLTLLPIFHWHVHFVQVLNFAPWAVSILLCFVALEITKRLGLVPR